MTKSSKTATALAANREAGKGSLIGYFPLGYPNLDASVDAAIAMSRNAE